MTSHTQAEEDGVKALGVFTIIALIIYFMSYLV